MDLVRHYLDYNSTSPLSQSVKSWLVSGDVFFANPSSQHHLGKLSRKSINQVTDSILKAFSLVPSTHKILFHSGASEAFSSFAYSFDVWSKQSKRKLLICYSDLDHPAVTSQVNKSWGDNVLFLRLEQNQDFTYSDEKNLAEILRFKRDYPDLIVLYHHLWVHNEVGSVASLENLTKFKAINDLFIHVDSVQAPGKIPDWKVLSVGDIFTFSAHKFGALKGVGFSIYSSSLVLLPFITGGGQQALRSGTENAMGVKSIELALKDLSLIDFKINFSRKAQLEELLTKELDGIGAVLSSDSKISNSNTIYFYFHRISSDVALALFDLNGLMISAGSACSSGAAKPSAVLMHKGLRAYAKNGLRLSLPFNLNEAELSDIENKLKVIFNKIRETNF